MTRTLYRTLLGGQFEKLPDKLQEMHGGASLAKGCADIKRGTSPLARFICALSHIPKTGRDVPIETSFEQIEGGERWTRRFDGEAFQTDMLIDHVGSQPRLSEKFGPFLFRLKVIAHDDGIDLIPDNVSLWGLSLPKILCPEAVGLERERDGRYHFDVSVRFPLAGEVLSYQGWIEPVA